MVAAILIMIAVSAARAPRPSEPPGRVLAVGDDTFAGEATSGGDIPEARALASRETWDALLPRLQEAAGAHPDDATAQRRLAIAYTNLGRLDEAAAIYHGLLQHDDDALVHDRLGNILRDQGDLDGAEREYRAALAADPTLPAPYANLAELLWRTRREDEARTLLGQGLDNVAPAARPALERVRDGLEPPTSDGPAASPPGT